MWWTWPGAMRRLWTTPGAIRAGRPSTWAPAGAAACWRSLETFQRVNGVAVPHRIGPRRPGDLPTCYAATDKAARLLHWHAEKDLADMCRDSWRWQQSQQ